MSKEDIMKEVIARFEQLEAWQMARALTRSVYVLTHIPVMRRYYGLVGQIRRASVSVMSNIAEGFARSHLGEKLQSYNIARASVAEVRSLLYVIEDNFQPAAEAASALRDETDRVGRLMTGLIHSTEARRPWATAANKLRTWLFVLAG